MNIDEQLGAAIQKNVADALAEDVGSGDLTASLVPETSNASASIFARENAVMAGRPWVDEVYAQLDPDIRIEWQQDDGDRIDENTVLCEIEGPARAVLTGERTALNFLQTLSATATVTACYVAALKGTDTRVLDTRKTVPGFRTLDKFAVLAGGGRNHRFALYDGILLKDNHVAAAGGVSSAVKTARAGAPVGLRVQVEVESLDQARAACEAGADFLLLDNRSPDEVHEIVQELGERTILEASGGIDLDNVRTYAETGVHRISVGALTHSAPWADVALEVTGS